MEHFALDSASAGSEYELFSFVLVQTIFSRPLSSLFDIKGLLAAHEVATDFTHELAALSDSKKVQHLLSSERHEAVEVQAGRSHACAA